jgi:hypothetical protein
LAETIKTDFTFNTKIWNKKNESII